MATRKQNDADRQEHLHELADQFGEGVGNAEDLINANARRRTQELATISALPVLADETADLDLDKLEGPDGEYVVDAAVRGSGRTRGTVVVYEDETGRQLKALIDSTIDERPTGTRKSSHVKNEEGEDGGKAKAKVADAA